MKLRKWLRKMPGSRAQYVRVTKFLIAAVTVFCVSWIVCVNEWHSVRWRQRSPRASTMRTIVGYSEGKQAEMDRPSPVTCDRIPAMPTVPIFNRTWYPDEAVESSWQQVPGTSVSLYAAYYDERLPLRYIRILASFRGKNNTAEPLFCQTRRQGKPFDDSVEVVAAKQMEIWYEKWDSNSKDMDTPLLLSCPLTEPLNNTTVVSIVTEPCEEPANGFQVKPNGRKTEKYKRTFTICVKNMNFDKYISQDIIEWIETNKLLGVDLIDMYIDSITKEIEEILQYYRDTGYVRLFHVPTKNTPDRSLWQRRRDHVVTYNDCLYRNIRESEYIVPLDVDEIILPKIADNWRELVERLQVRGWNQVQKPSVMIRNLFFFDFMQDRNYNIKNKLKNKIYTKRDDVRIEDTFDLYVNELELVDDTDSILNEVIVNSDNSEIYELYKLRCGRELPVPKLARHVMSSSVASPMGRYGKSLMLTSKVLTAFNHYPLANLPTMRFVGWMAPFEEVQINHYKESCNTTIVEDCGRYTRRARFDRAALRLRRRLTLAVARTVCAPINQT